MPAGGSIHAWYIDSHGAQQHLSSETSTLSFTGTGWNHVYAEVWDTSGKVVAELRLDR